jgi:hypothetical protein
VWLIQDVEADEVYDDGRFVTMQGRRPVMDQPRQVTALRVDKRELEAGRSGCATCTPDGAACGSNASTLRGAPSFGDHREIADAVGVARAKVG